MVEGCGDVNGLVLTGCLVGEASFSHALAGERFCRLTLAVRRKSGVDDLLPLITPERALPPGIADGMALGARGQLRSYGFTGADGTPRLHLTAFARCLFAPQEQEHRNEVCLLGTLTRAPVYRHTPLRREITDLMLAVDRGFGKVDCVPVITWGRCARQAALLPAGTRLRVFGRFQSRAYEKSLPDGAREVRMAYEVSAACVEPESRAGADPRG